jgi:hypothetical protein
VVTIAQQLFLSHTSELRQYPAEGSFVAAAEETVMLAAMAITDMEYFAAQDERPEGGGRFGESSGPRWLGGRTPCGTGASAKQITWLLVLFAGGSSPQPA